MSYEIFFWICLLMVFKALTIGSEFNFRYWYKYKEVYTLWYFNRRSFKQHLESLRSE